MSVIIAILIFSAIILIHEIGHYVAARRCGILVEEFAIGMGPRLIELKRGETVFSIRAFPIGGFCAMLGEDDGSSDPRAFNSKTAGQRFLVLSAGVIMNFLLAFAIFTGLAFFSMLSEPMVNRVEENSPAMNAGLQKGDRITKVNSDSVNIYEDLIFALNNSGGEAVEVVILRGGEKITRTITPRLEDDGSYKIGFELVTKTGFLMEREQGFERAGFLESLKNGFFRIVFYIRVTLYGVGQLITMKISPGDISGIVGITGTISRSYTASAQAGFDVMVRTMLMYMAILSANLGVMNFLPLPALDGGRLVFVVLEFIRRKPVPPEKEGMVHLAGLVLLMVLSVAIAYNDIVNLLAR